MGRIVRKEIPWNGGTVIADIRVWSARERDMHDRKYLLGGEKLVAGIIGALSDPHVNTAKSLQIIRTLVDDQRKRAGELGGQSAMARLATVLLSVEGPGFEPLKEDFDIEARQQWVDSMDADLFDALLKAADEALYLAPEDKKKSKTQLEGRP